MMHLKLVVRLNADQFIYSRGLFRDYVAISPVRRVSILCLPTGINERHRSA